MNKLGIKAFDKALSPADAALKKLEEMANQSKDLESASQNMDLEGKSNEELALMMASLKENMAKAIDTILQDVINKEIKET